jgi:hypothetical protein
MNWVEFNSTAIRNERSGVIELDLRPFGPGQGGAVDFWLEAALKQGDPFGKAFVLKTDASVVLSASAREYIAKLRDKNVLVSCIGER